MNKIIIRKETENDYTASEYLALRAFWNQHGPGCNEHYLVHILRNEKCYVEELSRVAECDGRIVGLIMYSKAKVVDGDKAVAEGYQVARSTKLKSGFKTMIRTTKMTYKNTKNLKKGTRYYYKVRAYATAEDGTILYSDWSNKAYRKAK